LRIGHRIRVLLTEPTGCTLTDSSLHRAAPSWASRPPPASFFLCTEGRTASFDQVSDRVSVLGMGRFAPVGTRQAVDRRGQAVDRALTWRLVRNTRTARLGHLKNNLAIVELAMFVSLHNYTIQFILYRFYNSDPIILLEKFVYTNY
jgi:hypothetical protein